MGSYRPSGPPAPRTSPTSSTSGTERVPIVLASNRALSEWPESFGEPRLASAALDRLTPRAHFVEITGTSYRAE